PGRERAILLHAGRHIDDAGRAEIGPGELLLPRPDDLDRLARGLGEPGRLDGRLVGVFAAVTRAGVRHDDVDLFLLEAEGVGQVAPCAEGTLRPGPDGQPAVLPLGHGRAWLQRRVRDVGDGVRRLQLVVCRGQPLLDVALALVAPPASEATLP